MSFLLIPGLSHFVLATAIIEGGGVAFAKSIRGQNTVHQSVTLNTQQSIPSSVTVSRTDVSSSTKKIAETEVQSSPSQEQAQENQVSLQQESLTEEVQVPVKLENCQIINHLSNIPEAIKLETQNYVTVSCEDKTSDSFPESWKGLFPKSIFKTGEELSEGQEFEIKIRDVEEGLSDSMEDTEQEYWTKITISSSKFTELSLSAEWSYLKENDSWAVIKLTKPTSTENIYLLLNEEEAEEEVVLPKNCEVINSLKNVPESFKGFEGNYFSLSCNVSGLDTFPDLLKGLFPKDLFKEQNQLTSGKRLDIKLETKMDVEETAEGYGITFFSDQFSSSTINGTWDYDEGDGAIVKLQNDKQIYLLLRED